MSTKNFTIDSRREICYNRKAMANKGKFIVFEGTDGSGKSTQRRLLANYLREKRIACFETREPTYSPFGTILHDCMKGRLETDEYTIALLFAADRSDHIRNAADGILRKLEEGVTVLCDRYYLSSFAYNGGFVPLDWVIELNRSAIETLRPDLTIFLDVNVEESMARVGHRAAQERYEERERQKIIRANYFKLFEKFPEERVAVIESQPEREATQALVRRAVEECFGGSL